MYLTWTVNSTSKAHSVLSYCLFQSSRDFACHLMHKLYTRMQQGPKLMLKYSATLLDKAMWCWQFSQITVRYTGRYNQALYTIQNKIIYIFFFIPSEFSDCSLSSASEMSDSSFNSSANFQRTVNVERQLDGDACQEAMSLLNHTTDNSLIFQKMRETFQHRQKLVNDPGRSIDILSTFPRFLDTKGLVSLEWDVLEWLEIWKYFL